MKVIMVATAPGLMKYLSAALSSVWVSPGLISTGSTVSLPKYLALTFARTTERANRHHLQDCLLCYVIKKHRGESREQGRKMEDERWERRTEKEWESSAALISNVTQRSWSCEEACVLILLSERFPVESFTDMQVRLDTRRVIQAVVRPYWRKTQDKESGSRRVKWERRERQKGRQDSQVRRKKTVEDRRGEGVLCLKCINTH